MSWLSDRLGLHWGNVGGPIGALAGSFIPGVGTAAGAAFGQGLGALGHGDGLGSALLQGGLTYGGGKALGALQQSFAPSSAGGGIPGVGGDASQIGNVAQAGAPQGSGGFGGNMWGNAAEAGRQLATPQGGSPGGGFWSSAGNAARGIGQFAAHNPTATGMGLQGLGNIATSNSTNAMNNAQRQQIEGQNATSAYELEQRKRRDASLEPLRRLLAGQMNGFMQNNHGIAPNPYGP